MDEEKAIDFVTTQQRQHREERVALRQIETEKLRAAKEASEAEEHRLQASNEAVEAEEKRLPAATEAAEL